MTDPGQVRKFRHIRKGLVEGRIVREDETWAQIELARDHRLAYGSECNRGRIDEAGEILTVRRSFLTEIIEPSKENS